MTPNGPQWTGEIRTRPENVGDPFHWRKPRRVFVNSMSDLFHEKVPEDFIADVFGTMMRTPHEYQILTKRPGRMADILLDASFKLRPLSRNVDGHPVCQDWPPRNVIVGTSIEDQRAIKRIEPVIDLGVAGWRTMLSLEPLLGPIDLSGFLPHTAPPGQTYRENIAVRGSSPISWIIPGGESGHGARRADLAWFRSIRDQARDSDTAFFMKQVGSVLARELGYLDSKGEDMNEWPEDLRIREFPAAVEVFA